MQCSILTIFVENGDLLTYDFIFIYSGRTTPKVRDKEALVGTEAKPGGKNLDKICIHSAYFLLNKGNVDSMGSQITLHCNAKNMFHIKLPHQTLLNQGVDDIRINQWNPLRVVINPRQRSHSYGSTTNEAYIFHLYGKYSLGNGAHPCMP